MCDFTRMSLSAAWLGMGCLMAALSQGDTAIPLAAWFGPVFWIRFVRSRRSLVGYAWLAAAGTTLTALAVARGLIPFAGPAAAFICVFTGLTTGIPYLFDRALSRRLVGFGSTLAYPSIVTAIEFITTQSSPTGTFGAIAYTQSGNLALMQLVSVTGMWGITFLVTWFGSVVNWVWERQMDWQRCRCGVAIYAGSLVAVLLFGSLRLAHSPLPPGTVHTASFTAWDSPQEWKAMLAHIPEGALRSALLHADNRQKVRLAGSDDGGWMELLAQPGSRSQFRQLTMRIRDTYLQKTARQAAAGAQIVLWPEGAGVTLPEDEADLLEQAQELARRDGIYLAVPLYVLHSDGPVENRVVLIDPAGAQVLEHVKFGGNELEQSVGGDGLLRTVATEYGTISAAICWDMDFPSTISQSGSNGTDLLLVPANDWGAIRRTHARMSVVRAIENGISVVRHAYNGISLATDPYGRVLSTADHFELGHRLVVAQVPTAGVATVYSTIGDLVGWLAVVTVLGLVLLSLHRRRAP